MALTKFKIRCFSIALLLFVCCSCKASISETNDIILLRQQFVKYLIGDVPNDSVVGGLFQQLKANGTWDDINYKSDRRGSWETLQHLTRLVSLSQAYANPDSRYYENPELLQSILSGLNHWLDEDYVNSNWWNGKIGAPEAMLKTFLLLEEDLPEEVLSRAQSSVLKRTAMGMTGQNKVWLAGIAFMKAVLEEDRPTMEVAAKTIWSELKVTTDEGIQPDWSFHQHGPQQQFGNYGQHFAERSYNFV